MPKRRNLWANIRDRSRRIKMEYKEEDYIQVAEDGSWFGTFREYKYRVIGRNGYPNHHTNSLNDAKIWLEKCKAFWIKCDKREGKP